MSTDRRMRALYARQAPQGTRDTRDGGWSHGRLGQETQQDHAERNPGLRREKDNQVCRDVAQQPEQPEQTIAATSCRESRLVSLSRFGLEACLRWAGWEDRGRERGVRDGGRRQEVDVEVGEITQNHAISARGGRSLNDLTQKLHDQSHRT